MKAIRLTQPGQELELAAAGKLNLSEIVTNRVSLAAKAVNQVLDRLEEFGGAARTVITC